MNYRLAGRYKFEAVKADGTRRPLTEDWCNNLVLDAGLNRLGTGGAYSFAMVGTGTTAPGPTQTILAAQLASTNNQTNEVSGVDLANGFAWNRRTFRFTAGTATGNLTEVGVGWTSTACFSRALITDTGGTPISVTVLADEHLDVTYELRMYWPTSDVVSTPTISGTSYTVTARAAAVGSWTLAGLINNGARDDLTPPGQATTYSAGALGGVTVEPGGTAQYGINMTYLAAYSNNSLQRDYRGQWDGTKGESAIGSVRVSTPFGIYKFGYSPSLPKSGSNTLTLDFRMSWARYTEFVGVNPSIGNLTVNGTRVSASGSETVQARVEFRADGTIYATTTNVGGGTTTAQIGQWYIPVTANIGDGYQAQITNNSGTGGTYTSNANGTFTTMSGGTAVYADLTFTTTGVIAFSRNLTYTIRTLAGSTVVATGTIDLSINREN